MENVFSLRAKAKGLRGIGLLIIRVSLVNNISHREVATESTVAHAIVTVLRFITLSRPFDGFVFVSSSHSELAKGYHKHAETKHESIESSYESKNPAIVTEGVRD